MFYDLKEVLNLNRFYAANVNAVAMQVYASALVYVAMRIAHAHIARDARVEPERLSPQKLYPRIAVASHELATGELVFEATQDANPETELREPPWDRMEFASVSLGSVLVEPRNDKRRQRRYCLARRRHASLHRYTRKQRRR